MSVRPKAFINLIDALVKYTSSRDSRASEYAGHQFSRSTSALRHITHKVPMMSGTTSGPSARKSPLSQKEYERQLARRKLNFEEFSFLTGGPGAGDFPYETYLQTVDDDNVETTGLKTEENALHLVSSKTGVTSYFTSRSRRGSNR